MRYFLATITLLFATAFTAVGCDDEESDCTCTCDCGNGPDTISADSSSECSEKCQDRCGANMSVSYNCS